MTAYQLLQLLSQLLFIFIAVTVTVKAIQHPTKGQVDTALFFGAASLIVAIGWINEVLSLTPGRLSNSLSSSLLMALSYMLLRLVDDFAELPGKLLRAAGLGLAAIVVTLFVVPPPYPAVFILLCVLYFIAATTYVAIAFIMATRVSSGVTRRRMQAVAAGSLSLGLAILLIGTTPSSPRLTEWWSVLSSCCALVCGLFFFLGFAPPSWLRRTWQEPEVRAFLGRAAFLPRLPDTTAIIRELERGAANSLGAADARIGIWDPDAAVIRYNLSGSPVETRPDELIGGRAFIRQEPIFSANAERDDPDNADTYRRVKARAILAAPITAGEKRLGVLTIYSPRAPIFADDDLRLVSLLANQAAVILESRVLIDAAARVQAREEAARLKDDFLSAAAHDLKTPLTALVAQAQLLERRTKRHPTQPADAAGISVMVTESQRLKRLVMDLLDVARVEQGMLVSQRETVDLAEMAREACQRHSGAHHHYVLEAPSVLYGEYDGTRIMQLLDNLLENASKYSPVGGEVHVRLWQDGTSMCLTVTDSGIGIPATDLPNLFDRFHRGSNVNDRRFAGMGLGLFICRGIVEQHGGSIWATSSGLEMGSTFHVVLPANTASRIDWQASPTRPVPQTMEVAMERAQ